MSLTFVGVACVAGAVWGAMQVHYVCNLLTVDMVVNWVEFAGGTCDVWHTCTCPRAGLLGVCEVIRLPGDPSSHAGACLSFKQHGLCHSNAVMADLRGVGVAGIPASLLRQCCLRCMIL